MSVNNLLFDTNAFVYAFAGYAEYANLLAQAVRKQKLFLSSLVYAELHASPIKAHGQKIDRLLSITNFISLDEEVSKLGGQLRQSLTKKKTKLILIDCLIAATAIVHGCALVTKNKKDFQFKDLIIVSPSR